MRRNEIVTQEASTQPVGVELIAMLVAVADGRPLAMTIEDGRASCPPASHHDRNLHLLLRILPSLSPADAKLFKMRILERRSDARHAKLLSRSRALLRPRRATTRREKHECGVRVGHAPNRLDRPRQNGTPISERLAAQGFEVATLTRNPEGRERATRANLQSESNIGGVVASADIVVSAVSDDAALLDIAFQAGGLKETLDVSQIFVEISTLSPSASRRVAEAMSAIGVGYIRSPVWAQRRWRRRGP